MTGPQDPYPHNPFGASAPPYPDAAPQPVAGPPGSAPDEVNTLATLSVIFAFVFAPAGAVLGHLGLSQIARTHQRGRDRALVGLTLSYVVITAAVVALVVWAVMGHNDTHPATASPTTTAARPPAPSAPPPAPTVKPADVPALLPNLQQAKDLTGNQALTEGPSTRAMTPSTITVDPPDCLAVLASGAQGAYNAAAVRGYLDTQFVDLSNPATGLELGLDAVGFEQPAAARAQLDDLLAQWKRCAAGTAQTRYPDGRTWTASFTQPTDAGEGITTIETRVAGLTSATVHAIAAKANVIVDIFLQSQNADPGRTLTVIKSILAKIPG